MMTTDDIITSSQRDRAQPAWPQGCRNVKHIGGHNLPPLLEKGISNLQLCLGYDNR